MEDLGEWYQTIDIDDNLTKGRPGKGDVRKAWENIKQFLPETLEGMRILVQKIAGSGQIWRVGKEQKQNAS